MVNGIVYVVGGQNATGVLATMEAYDPISNTWTTKTSMPTARTGAGAGVINGIIYVAGGLNNASPGMVVVTVEAYDPTTNAWTTKAPMPTARHGLGVGVVNGILYAVGGAANNDGSGFLNVVEAYDPSTNTWTTKAPMPTARQGFAEVGVVNGILYAIGGYNGAILQTVEAYNPGTDTWTTRTSMPTARYFPGVGVLNGTIYVAGGTISGPDNLTTLEAYNPGTDTWTNESPMPTGRYGMIMETVGGSLYAVGGIANGISLAVNEAFTPCTPPPSGMVSWWPGDGNADDIADGNNGTLMGGTTFAPGKVDQAFSLDGVDDFIKVGNPPNLQFGNADFSVDAWVHFSATTGDMALIDKMLSTFSINNQNGWRLLKQNDDRFWFCFGRGISNGCVAGGPTTVQSTTLVVSNMWYHVAAVRAANTISIYVNGILENQKTFGDTPVNMDVVDLLFGSHVVAGTPAFFLNGEIDEIEVFNRALSPAEIQAIFQADTAGKCKIGFRQPATLTLAPKTATNTAGDTHCVTATVNDAFGNPVPNITVDFSVPTAVATHASPSTGSSTTNTNGVATFCYSASLPGEDTIHAFADTNGNTQQDAGEPFDDATKTWIPPANTAFCEVTITEGGWIFANNGDRANFGGNARVAADGSSVQGQENYQDQGPAQPMSVHSIQLTATTCSADLKTATIFGTATIDGSGMYVFRIDLIDQGKSGTNDAYGIILSNGYASGQHQLGGGNVTIHE